MQHTFIWKIMPLNVDKGSDQQIWNFKIFLARYETEVFLFLSWYAFLQ